MDYAMALVAGASATYTVGLALGVAPPLFAEKDDLRDWARNKWGPEARTFLDYLDANWSYGLFRPKLTNRNFIHAQPEATRIRFVCYTSIWERKMRGVAKFGLRPASAEGLSCVNGGHVAAAADQILGIYAMAMMFFPVVTANLEVKYLEAIPLGTELAFVCNVEEGSDSIKKLVVSLKFYSLRPKRKSEKKVHVVVTAIFVNSVLPNFIKSML
jgi:acyl-coenzyme A thioesterase PaaI-like protein